MTSHQQHHLINKLNEHVAQNNIKLHGWDGNEDNLCSRHAYHSYSCAQPNNIWNIINYYWLKRHHEKDMNHLVLKHRSYGETYHLYHDLHVLQQESILPTPQDIIAILKNNSALQQEESPYKLSLYKFLQEVLPPETMVEANNFFGDIAQLYQQYGTKIIPAYVVEAYEQDFLPHNPDDDLEYVCMFNLHEGMSLLQEPVSRILNLNMQVLPHTNSELVSILFTNVPEVRDIELLMDCLKENLFELMEEVREMNTDFERKEEKIDKLMEAFILSHKLIKSSPPKEKKPKSKI